MSRWVTPLASCTACYLLTLTAAADPLPEEHLFDPPLSNQELEATEAPHPTDALRCHYYPDLMIRETQTDTPAMGPSYIVPPGPAGARSPCRAPATPRTTKLAVASETFLARKGPYLFYEATDANGASPFEIIHLPEARTIYTDKKSDFQTKNNGYGIEAVTLDSDALHLRYTRAYNASCSLPKDGAKCWTKAMREGHFPAAIATRPPPLADCAAAYKASAQIPVTDPSIIIYEVEMTLPPAGKPTILSRGKTGCLPSP